MVEYLKLISDSYLTCTSENKNAWTGIRSTHGVSSGRYYFKAKIIATAARIGWGTFKASRNLGKLE